MTSGRNMNKSDATSATERKLIARLSNKTVISMKATIAKVGCLDMLPQTGRTQQLPHKAQQKRQFFNKKAAKKYRHKKTECAHRKKYHGNQQTLLQPEYSKKIGEVNAAKLPNQFCLEA